MTADRWTAMLTTLLLAVPAGQPARTRWGECPFEASTTRCATVAVPVDYGQPGGTTIDLHVARTPARDPGHRLGVLVTSTGGPAAHLADAAALTERLPAEMLDRYDIVSFDQRGFGRSAPLTCGLRPDQQYTIPWPLETAAATTERARTIARQCAERGGELLSHMGTADVARDVDRIRQFLKADRISFLGISYGTYLGTAYGAMFPGRVRRMLLDSVVDGTRGWREVWREALTSGFETRLRDFGESPAEIRRLLAGPPLETPAGTIGATQLRIALYGAMYNDAAFPALSGLLTAVRERDAAAAAKLSTELQVWYDDDNTASGQMAVFCADGTFPRSPEVYAREAAADAVRHPLTGGASSAIWPCAFWPAEAPAVIRPREGAEVLLINATRDPATTLAGAQRLRHAFGDRARLVSADHGGHGVYLRSLDAARLRAAAEGRREQRLRTARDLHDFFAHEVTGIVLEAQAARLDADDGTAATLTRIEEAGQRALAAVDRAMELTRSSEPAGLDDLADVVGRFASGAPMTVRLDAAPVGVLDPAVAGTARRVVMEALTNVRRHAATAGTVLIRVRREATALIVSVSDDGDAPAAGGLVTAAPGGGASAAARPAGGTGLAALSRDVAALGGSLQAGPGDPAGWTVRAALPVPS
ncbi:alpha/beta fold hydrolase [Symbioplanes lichenis]|uniref:alpha/beta fold hydrolase n=1 Tax=Symbioplanes lichenis TaxID=1629072 RepID=UPI0027392DA9|nr:alpha/beta fold hydrolase [Actinoplanes lichenis]